MENIILPKSKLTIGLISEWTWGQMKKIQQVYLKGMKGIDVASQTPKDFDYSVSYESTILAFSMAIIKITNEKGEEIKFSKEWAEGLPIKDGELLEKKVNEIGEEDKKKEQE